MRGVGAVHLDFMAATSGMRVINCKGIIVFEGVFASVDVVNLGYGLEDYRFQHSSWKRSGALDE
jgi:hypothetical protein